jgi:signal transduction histidine kinase
MNTSTVLPPASVLAIAPAGSELAAALQACWPDAELEQVPDIMAGRRLLSVWVPELVVTVFPPPGGLLSSLAPGGGPLCIALTSSLEADLQALEGGASEVCRGTSPQDINEAFLRMRARLFESAAEPVPRALHPYFTGIAHEVNNPLTVIQTSLDLLTEMPLALAESREDPDEHALIVEDVADLIDQCKSTASRIKRVTRRLMALQRVGDTRVQDVRPEPPVRRALERIRAAFPDRPVPEVDWQTSAKVHAATLSIEEGLYELLHNAMIASPEPGSVRVEVAQLEHAVEFRVVDQGPGVHDSVRSMLFEPFKTTRAPGEGPGLGLTLVQAAASRCGGEAGCARPEGGPTVFWFQLPLGVSSEPAASSADPGEEPTGPAPRVLLWDEDEVRSQLRIAAVEDQLRVVHASSLPAVVTLLSAIRDWDALVISTEADPVATEALLESLLQRDAHVFERNHVVLVHDGHSPPLPLQSRHNDLTRATTDTLAGAVSLGLPLAMSAR